MSEETAAINPILMKTHHSAYSEHRFYFWAFAVDAGGAAKSLYSAAPITWNGAQKNGCGYLLRTSIIAARMARAGDSRAARPR